MAATLVKRLFQRFFAIILTLFVLNFGVLIQNDVIAELVASPGRDYTEPCLYQHQADGNDDHAITIHGSSTDKCKLEISTSNSTSGLYIELKENFPYNYFLYVRRFGTSTQRNCPYNFAMFDGHDKPCGDIILDRNIEFNLLGDFSILVKEVSDEQPTDSECDIDGGVYYDHLDISPKLDKCSAHWYQDSYICDTPHDSTQCVFDFPQYCYSTLGYREVSQSCGDKTITKSLLVIYPHPMYLLDASENNIVAIDSNAFRNMNETKSIFLQRNKLSILHSGTFRDLPNLDSLNIQGNTLARIDAGCFHGLELLTFLDLSNNLLNRLPWNLFQTLVNLEELYLNGNQIDFLNVTSFHGLHNLKKLNLEGNRLATLDAGIFRDLQSLDKLDLDRNRFSTFNVGLFDGLRSLEILDVDYNQISLLDPDVFQDLVNLREFDIDNNQLEALDAGLFRGLVNMVEIDLDVNQLSRVDVDCFRGLVNLEELELDGNRLDTIDNKLIHGLWNLTILGLAINTFDRIDVDLFQGFGNLRELYIHDNYIVTFEVGSFDGLESLTELALSHNRLVAIDAGLFKDLHNLVSLRLDGNRLGIVSSGVFRGLFSLEALYLDDNMIEYLEAGLFQDLTSLDKLTLQKNKLKLVDADLLENTERLVILDLSDNGLQMIPNITHLDDLLLVILNRNEFRQIQSDDFTGLENDVQLLVSQHEICECYVPRNVSCRASLVRSPYLTCDRLLSDRVLVMMMWIIGISALCGNTFVLCWRNKYSGKYKVQSVFFSNLAMSDLLMGVYMITIAIADIYYGEAFPMAAETWRTGITCKIAGALSIISSEASVFFITIISVDRFINIKYPFNTAFKFGSKSTIVTTVFIWVFSAAIGIVPSILAGNNPDFYDNSHVCVGLPLALIESFSSNTTTKEVASTKYNAHTIDITRSLSLGRQPGLYFSTAVFLGLNCACYLVIFCCYVIIIQEVRKSSKLAGITPEMKDQFKMTAKVTAIVATDFLCWSPIILLGILVQTQVVTLPPSVFAWSVTFVLPINSAINPYLYTIADLISSRKDQNRSHQSMHQSIHEVQTKGSHQKVLSKITEAQETVALPAYVQKTQIPGNNI